MHTSNDFRMASAVAPSPVTTAAPKNLSILYLGPNSGTSLHRAFSLTRLGHNVQILDAYDFLPVSQLTDFWIHRTGAWGLEQFIRSRVLNVIQSTEFDVIWVDAGDLIGPKLVRSLKAHAKFVINYNVDDPYGARDSNKWRLYLQSVPIYDLVVVVRDCNVDEARMAGAKQVMRVHRSSDEVAHAMRALSLEDETKWKSEVAFVGTWMPERGPLLARLVECGIPLSIWGNRWSRAREWPILKSHWRGPGLENEEDYAKALQCAKVCIGLLSKGNRDSCTQRSFEIPHLAGVLCAERTPEHLSLYKEDEEAAFWSDADECAEKCKMLLADDAWRSAIAKRGHLRAILNGTRNEVVMNHIITRVFTGLHDERLCSDDRASNARGMIS